MTELNTNPPAATRKAESFDVPPFQLRDLQVAMRRFWGTGAKQVSGFDAYRVAGYTGPAYEPAISLFGATDAAMIKMAQVFARDIDGRRRAEIAAEVQETLALHQAKGWAQQPERYHAPPVVPAPVAGAQQGSWEILTHESSYAVPEGEPGAARWRGRLANRTAVLRVRRVPGDRPWLMLLHGAGMGQLRIDVGMFDAERLGDRLGMNIVMPVLPLHGPRRTPGPLVNSVLPLIDTVDTLHGLAQAVHDVRCALAWVRTQSDQAVRLYGFSLGGFTAAAVSALEPEFGAVLLGMPLIDATEAMTSKIARRQREAPWFTAHHDAGRLLLSVTSPLGLPEPATPKARRAIIAGRADRFVPPLEHAVRLANHWGGQPVEWVRASHTSHVRSPRLREFVEAFLGRR